MFFNSDHDCSFLKLPCRTCSLAPAELFDGGGGGAPPKARHRQISRAFGQNTVQNHPANINARCFRHIRDKKLDLISFIVSQNGLCWRGPLKVI